MTEHRPFREIQRERHERQGAAAHAAALEEAWRAVDAANAALGWYVGQPSLHDERHQWEQYAFDPTERPKVDVRSREWTAVVPENAGDVACVLEMARCLAELAAGRAPR